jgi:elongation factor 2
MVDPGDGSVVFGSATQGWAITLRHFAKLYAAKLGCSPSKLLRRLWGDSYFNKAANKWTSNSEGGTHKRGTLRKQFCAPQGAVV